MSDTLTFGQKAVGLKFNPSNDSKVDRIKIAAANLIDELHAQREAAAKTEYNPEIPEVIDQYTLAIREIQTGQMWGVKAATWSL